MDNILEDNTISITNIKWHVADNIRSILDNKIELPSEFSLSIPGYLEELKLKTDAKSQQKFKDEIESFVYSFLTKKFGVECTSCQIWLPLEDEDK